MSRPKNYQESEEILAGRGQALRDAYASAGTSTVGAPLNLGGCPWTDLNGRIEHSKILTTKSKEENIMTNRRVVTIQLIDDSKGLEVSNSLVASYKDVMTEDDDATTVQEILMVKDIAAKLKAHNKVRSETDNQDIIERTGNSVKLRPVKLKDLRWVVKG